MEPACLDPLEEYLRHVATVRPARPVSKEVIKDNRDGLCSHSFSHQDALPC